MVKDFISSVQNPKVRALLALQQRSAERRKSGLFVVEGLRELQHCVDAGMEIDTVFYCPEILQGAGTEVLAGLKAPEFLREQVPVLIEKHMTKLKPEEAEVRQQVNALGWNTVNNLLYLQEADMTSKGVDEPLTLEQFPQLRILLNQIGANEP